VIFDNFLSEHETLCPLVTHRLDLNFNIPKIAELKKSLKNKNLEMAT